MTLHRGMSYADYEALPGWRWSHIRLLQNGSPRAVRHAVNAGDDDDTASRGLLRAIHALVFEPHRFDLGFSVFDGTRRGKAFDAHVLCYPGTTVLNLREHGAALEAAEAIRYHPDVKRLLADGEGEVTLTWTDGATGLPCKARLDWLGAAGVLDLKTLGTTHERAVARLVASRLYHAQLAHYVAGSIACGLADPSFGLPAYLIAAEGRGCQDVAVFRLDDAPPDGPLFVGAQLRAKLMGRLAECVARDRWPGRHEGVQDLVLPFWALEDPDAAMTFAEEEA